MLNKRGQGLSVNAIILIILGVVVLVMLVVGFTMGWSTILPWIKSNNVDTIVKSCETACATASTYDFCKVERTLKIDKDIKKEDKVVLEGGKDYTCDYLKDFQSELGVKPCSSINCGPEIEEDTETPEAAE